MIVRFLVYIYKKEEGQKQEDCPENESTALKCDIEVG